MSNFISIFYQDVLVNHAVISMLALLMSVGGKFVVSFKCC